MKKLLIVLAFAGLSMTSMAQDDPTLKYSVATNSFWSNWFIQVGADWNAYYSSQEHGAGNAKSPLKSFRSNPGASVAIGKWFTPGLGLRTKVQGIWGQAVYDKDHNPANRYWIANEQALFNLSNMLYGYNPNRVWNFIPFVGAGVGRSMTNNIYAMNLSCGILNTFRLSKKMAVNVELGWNRSENDLDGDARHIEPANSWEDKDNNLYAEIGLTFNLGKATWDKVPDVDAIKALSQSQIDALNAQLTDANNEITRLNNMLRNQKPVEKPQAQVVKEFVAAPVSVFFNINKSKIASRKDLVNLESMAKFAKENNAGLLVTGYADSKTGSAAYNQKLSESRAATVADQLVKFGVSRDKVETVGKGGVNDLSPVSYNRRAVVTVK
ncbi:MAG: OmpA family protein [Prevotella sp.]|nr:OmpA family protein [Prevotella sp.]